MKNLESPQILSDLYRDLRDRRLLPLVVVLIVGIAVVPIALAKSPEASPAPVAPAPVAAKSNAPAEQVVVSDPGLRDYKRRLAGDSPTDPFVQQFTVPTGATDSAASDTSAAGTSTDTTASGTSSAGTTSGSDTSSGSTSPSASSGGTNTAGGGQRQYFSYRVKVRAGQLDGTPLKVHDSVGFLTPLPSNSVAALQLLGVRVNNNFEATTAAFLVSPGVSSISGEGNCPLAGTTCQTLYLKPGEHEDFVWSDGLTYRVELVKFNLVTRNSPPQSGNGKSGRSRKSGRNGSSPRLAGGYFSF